MKAIKVRSCGHFLPRASIAELYQGGPGSEGQPTTIFRTRRVAFNLTQLVFGNTSNELTRII